MPHDVARHRLQTVVPRDQVVLTAQLAFEPGFLLRVEGRVFHQRVDFVVEVRVHQLQLWCAVLVEERHSGAVLNRLLEVVDRHIVAKHFPRALLTGNERRARKGQEGGMGQRGAHV